jgi:hypothetical protein
LLAGGATASLAAPSGTTGIAFDIPAQPLSQALELYSDATGWEVLYNSHLAEGRRSGAVQGTFTAEAALRLLLAGTGLAIRYTDLQSFVLVLAPSAPPRPSPADAVAVASAATRLTYYGRIQESLRQALCRNDGARPGRYRIAVQFWIDATGGVERYRRLASTGWPETDGRIDRVLRDLRIGEPPPAGFAQPVTILVVPQTPDVTQGCDSDGVAGLRLANPAP